jgi:hypothetical protein
MAKRKSSKKRTTRKRKSGTTRRRRTSSKRARAGITVSVANPGRRRRRVRRRSNPGIKVRRRRRNPGFGGSSLKTAAKSIGMLFAGVLGGALAARQVEAHVAQPPRTIGLLELGLGAGVILLSGKKTAKGSGLAALATGIGAGFAFAGGTKVFDSIMTPAAPTAGGAPAMPPTPTAGTFADPSGAAWGSGVPGTDPIGFVEDVDDLSGAEAMVGAVEDAFAEDGSEEPIFDDAFDPYGGGAGDYA